MSACGKEHTQFHFSRAHSTNVVACKYNECHCQDLDTIFSVSVYSSKKPSDSWDDFRKFEQIADFSCPVPVCCMNHRHQEVISNYMRSSRLTSPVQIGLNMYNAEKHICVDFYFTWISWTSQGDIWSRWVYCGFLCLLLMTRGGILWKDWRILLVTKVTAGEMNPVCFCRLEKQTTNQTFYLFWFLSSFTLAGS